MYGHFRPSYLVEIPLISIFFRCAPSNDCKALEINENNFAACDESGYTCCAESDIKSSEPNNDKNDNPKAVSGKYHFLLAPYIKYGHRQNERSLDSLKLRY